MTDEITRPIPQTRRDRRILRKRLEIMSAAALVFAQRGYAGTTTKDIAQAADLGESTLYNYFESKRDIFIAIASQKARTVDELLSTAKPKNRQEMVALMDKALELILTQALFTSSLLVEAWMDNDLFENYLRVRLRRVLHFVEDIITDQIAAGNFRPIPSDLGARMLIALTISAILPALRGLVPPPTPEERHKLAETIVGVLLTGMQASQLTS